MGVNKEGCGWYGLAKVHTVALRLVSGDLRTWTDCGG